MDQFSLGAFFEALFKYGREYGLTLWHFMGLAVVGMIIWVASRVASGAGKAVTGAQNVYVKMIEDLQKKADDDKQRNEARILELETRAAKDRAYASQLEADLEASRNRAAELARQLAMLRSNLPTRHDGETHEPPAATPDHQPDPA